MPKHYKDMIDELINKMDEDAPANAVAHGGVDMNPTGKKVKKKDDAEDVLRRTIMKKLGANVKENFDNNNVCLLYTSPSPRDLMRSRMPSSA